MHDQIAGCDKRRFAIYFACAKAEQSRVHRGNRTAVQNVQPQFTDERLSRGPLCPRCRSNAGTQRCESHDASGAPHAPHYARHCVLVVHGKLTPHALISMLHELSYASRSFAFSYPDHPLGAQAMATVLSQVEHTESLSQLEYSAAAKRVLARKPALFINNEWVSSTHGATVVVEDPSTGREVGRIVDASDADVDRAVTAARAAFD